MKETLRIAVPQWKKKKKIYCCCIEYYSISQSSRRMLIKNCDNKEVQVKLSIKNGKIVESFM